MNKKFALLITSASSAVALTAAVFGGANAKGLLLFSDSQPGGSITLDASNPDCPFADGQFVVSSAIGNPFRFFDEGMTRHDDVYTIADGGYLVNSTPLNGLYRMEISSVSAQTLHFAYSSKGHGEERETAELSVGLNVITFDSFDPSSVRFYAEGEDLTFGKVVLYYSCLAISTNSIDEAVTMEFDGLSVGYQGLLAPAGTPLSALDASHFRFFLPKKGEVYGNEVSNLLFAYPGLGSDKVVDGAISASVSFSYQDAVYSGAGFSLVGYSSYEHQIDSISLGNTRLRKQDSDALPAGLELDVRGEFSIYSASHAKIASVSSYESVMLTEDLVTSYDAEPFTKTGQHRIEIEYKGYAASCDYLIYDPDANNIRSLYSMDGGLSVPAGTSSEQFLAYVADKRFGITYYEYDPSLPQFTYLTAENFALAGNEFDGSSLEVFVPVTYQGYSGTISVRVKKEKGDLIGVYHNDDGAGVMDETIYRLALYQNGVAIAYYDKTEDVPSGEVAYTLVGATLTLYQEGVYLPFTLDEEAKTFGVFVPTATLLYTLAVDLTAFEAPEIDFVGKLFDDDTVTFDLGGTNILCPFAYDPSDNSLIYFSFLGEDAKGTIDYGKLRMVVVPIA